MMSSVPVGVMVFAAAIGLFTVVAMYYVVRSGRKKEEEVEETREQLESTGVQIPREEVRKIVEEESKKSVEEEVRARADEQAEERVKKATAGLHKSKGQKIILEFEDFRVGEENTVLGKLHSLDRLSLDNQHGYYVLYYFPIHNSVFLNGVQALIKLIGKGKKRLETPDELIMSFSIRFLVLRAKTLQSVDDKTFRVIPPERLEPAIDYNYFLRKANRTYKDLVTELMRSSNRFVKMGVMANPYHQSYASQQRMMQGQFPEDLENDFFAVEGKQLKEDRIKRAHNKLKNMDSRVEGGEEYA